MDKPGKKGQTLIMGQWRFGVGNDLKTAKANFRRFGGILSNGYTILTFDENTSFEGVDQMGRYHYIGNAPTIQEVPPKKSK